MTVMRCGLLMLWLSLAGHGASPAAKTATKISAKAKSTAQIRPRVAPFVTRDNFVSLSLVTSGGIANLTTSLWIQNNTISRSDPQRGGGGSGSQSYRPPATAALSNNQLDALLRALNEAKFPTLVGKYEQKNLADGIGEVLVLTVSDAKNRDCRWTIENYGDQAPAGYYKLADFLRDFVAMKFPQPAAPLSATAPPQ